MNQTLKILSVLAFFVFTACGKKDYEPQPASFEECMKRDKMFVDGACVAGSSQSPGNTRYSLLHERRTARVFHRNSIQVCLIDRAGNPLRALALETMIHDAVALWIEPLREIDASYAPSIQVSAFACADADAYVYLLNELKDSKESKGRAYARPDRGEIWMDLADVERGPGTIIHEFGHLFGLNDTYIEGKWDCRPEFPNSVMCDSAWKSLRPIDREQIQRVFCLETDGAAEGCFNHEAREFLAVEQDLLQEGVRVTRRPYVQCVDGEDRMEIDDVSIWRFGAGVRPRQRDFAKVERFYSTDAYSVQESFADGVGKLLLHVDDVDAKAIVPRSRSVLFAFDGNLARVEFEDQGEMREKAFSECYFGQEVIAYFSRKGIDVAGALFAHNDYNRLALGWTSQKGSYDENKELVKYLLAYSAGNGPDTVHVFGSDRSLLKSINLSEVAALVSFDQTTVYNVQVEIKRLELVAGSYSLVFARAGKTLLLGSLDLP